MTGKDGISKKKIIDSIFRKNECFVRQYADRLYY